jgi:hypothetical protein
MHTERSGALNNPDLVDPQSIISMSGLHQFLGILDEHFRRYNVGSDGFNEPFAASLIEAIAIQAKFFMLPTRVVHLVDTRLIPRAQQLSDGKRGELAVSLVLLLFQVAGETFTNLERGWRRVQVAEIAFDCQERGAACGEDPTRHFAAAVRLSRMCYREVGGPELWNKVLEVSERYDVPIQVVEE